MACCCCTVLAAAQAPALQHATTTVAGCTAIRGGRRRQPPDPLCRLRFREPEDLPSALPSAFRTARLVQWQGKQQLALHGLGQQEHSAEEGALGAAFVVGRPQGARGHHREL